MICIKAIHVLKLSNGRDRVVARTKEGFFWSTLSLQAPGITAELAGAQDPVTFLFVPISKIRAKFS